MTTKRVLTYIGAIGCVCGVLSERGIWPHTTGTVSALSVALIGFLVDGEIDNV